MPYFLQFNRDYRVARYYSKNPCIVGCCCPIYLKQTHLMRTQQFVILRNTLFVCARKLETKHFEFLKEVTLLILCYVYHVAKLMMPQPLINAHLEFKCAQFGMHDKCVTFTLNCSIGSNYS